MHKIHEKEFTLLDFSHDHMIPNSCILLEDTINMLNELRAWYLKWDHMSEKNRENFDQNIHEKKDLWWQMIQLLPSSYNQTRNVMLNYEVLANIYRQRKNHKLDCWRDFCSWIESLPYSELITGQTNKSRGLRSTAGMIDESGLKPEDFEKAIDALNAVGNINPLSAEDIKEVMKNFDPDSAPENHVLLMKE